MVVDLSSPEDLVAAYLMGRMKYGTGDLVLVVAQHDSEIISSWPRQKYIENALQGLTPKGRATVRLIHESAHQVTKLPVDSTAFWLVIEVRQLPMPIMTVLYEVAYEMSSAASLG